MRAPGFWHRPPGLWSRVLAPLSWVYAAGTARRLAKGTRTKLDVPVICVGNINAGGTGKTPTVIALAERLTARGRTPHVVSRGYGGSLEGPVQVSEQAHRAAQVGDEPLLLSPFLPTWVAKDRVAGAQAAADAGADVIVLDDGFQHAGLAYDLAIVVVDAARGFGNGKVLPAGPLREPLATGLGRADLVLAIGDDPAQDRFAKAWGGQVTAPYLTGALMPLPTGLPFAGLPVFAFAGIGHPEKFFTTLRQLGADIRRAEALADHQPLSETFLSRLQKEAKLRGAQLVTTEKDAVRLPKSFRHAVMTVPVRLQIDDASAVESALDRVLG